MSNSKDSHGQHNKIPSKSNLIDKNSQRTTKKRSHNISNHNSLPSSGLFKAESLLKQSISIIQKGNILRHSHRAQYRYYPKSSTKPFNITHFNRLMSIFVLY